MYCIYTRSKKEFNQHMEVIDGNYEDVFYFYVG